MSKCISTFLAFLLFNFTVACTTSTHSTDIPVEWSTYNNTEFKFSIQHPENLEVTQSEHGPYFKVGEQITIGISEMNPLECRGDCPVMEKQETVTLAGQDATKVSGYVGSVGGFIPQQYMSYVLNYEHQYYRFLVYAISSGETFDGEDMSTIRPLKAEDLELFEKIMSTLTFTN
jgi:hypothetical protein